ncbi:MAG: hypothetical protein ACYTEQ_01655 [Planctomycetota bacterium]|jgi:hypothetical protein
MGYTHYWYMKKGVINKPTWKLICADVRKVLDVCTKNGIMLADGFGENEPVVDDTHIWLNGSQSCGHARDSSIVIPWPSDTAGGVAGRGEDVKAGHWPAGVSLEKRACDGDCSYETFRIPRKAEHDEYTNDISKPWVFSFCKTAYRPYDIAVTACLVVLKHHLKDRIVVKSDGEHKDWFDGMVVCAMHLGYGINFKLDEKVEV